jgi:hypothetical protein
VCVVGYYVSISIFTHPSLSPTLLSLSFSLSPLNSKMSPAAAVGNFTRALLVRIPCKDKNVLLKYKVSPRAYPPLSSSLMLDQGLGLVQPRHGGSVTRVGLLGRLQGKRFADDVLDYSTNIETIDTRILV